MDAPPQEDIINIQAAPVTKEEISWIEYQAKEKQDTLKRHEETAKFLSGLSTISLAILAGPNNEAFKQISHLLLLKTGIVCWLTSIICTLAVLFPFRYSFIRHSARSIEAKYNKTAKVKYTLLILGTLFYLAGICITVYLYLFK